MNNEWEQEKCKHLFVNHGTCHPTVKRGLTASRASGRSLTLQNRSPRKCVRRNCARVYMCARTCLLNSIRLVCRSSRKRGHDRAKGNVPSVSHVCSRSATGADSRTPRRGRDGRVGRCARALSRSRERRSIVRILASAVAATHRDFTAEINQSPEIEVNRPRSTLSQPSLGRPNPILSLFNPPAHNPTSTSTQVLIRFLLNLNFSHPSSIPNNSYLLLFCFFHFFFALECLFCDALDGRIVRLRFFQAPAIGIQG